MADIIATDRTVGIGLNTSDQLYVPRDVEVIVSGDSAVFSNLGQSFHRVVVDGTLFSFDDNTIFLEENTTTGSGGHVVTIGQTGVVRNVSQLGIGAVILDGTGSNLENFGEISGGVGVALRGAANSEFFNAGTVSGNRSNAVSLFDANDATITNTGVMTGSGGIRLQSAGGAVVNNSGEIVAQAAGEQAIFASIADGGFTVNNSGLISAQTVAILGSGFGDTIINTGLIEGDVNLESGNDTFRAKVDGVVTGTVNGGNGGDTLVGANAADTLSGGGGIDLLRGRDGADALNGDGGSDELRGGRGEDMLDGGGGADVLNGGRGDDGLTGSGGADTFVFNRNAGDDVITDFEDGTDQIDLTAFGLRNADFAAIVAPALSNAGGATFLDLEALGGQGSVLIEGLNFGAADSSDFLL